MNALLVIETKWEKPIPYFSDDIFTASIYTFFKKGKKQGNSTKHQQDLKVLNHNQNTLTVMFTHTHTSHTRTHIHGHPHAHTHTNTHTDFIYMKTLKIWEYFAVIQYSRTDWCFSETPGDL